MKNLPYPESSNAIINKIRRRWTSIGSMVGVGLDPQPHMFPPSIAEISKKMGVRKAIATINRTVLDICAPHIVDVKINANFYHGSYGGAALEDTFSYIRTHHPEIIRIYDTKFADVTHTSEQMAEYVFDKLDADAILLNPYLGEDAIKPFTSRSDKLAILCVSTSNSSASEIQEVKLENGEPLWKFILKKAMSEWQGHDNMIPVLSATHPDVLFGIREIVGDLPILLAGVGVQGGDISSALFHCLDSRGFGAMIGSSRSIMYPPHVKGVEYEELVKRAILNFKVTIENARLACL